KPLHEPGNPFAVGFRRARDKKADGWPPWWLLGASRQRPRSRCAAQKRDELAPLHSITSSARSSSDVGTSTASAFAVLRFTTSSNLVGCSTGRSPGFAPLKILSTKTADRRNRSRKSTP